MWRPIARRDLAHLIQERDELKVHCLRMDGEAEEHRLHIARLNAHVAQLTAHIEQLTASAPFPPGHFYSPVVDVNDQLVVQAVREPRPVRDPSGIHIDQQAMEAFCEQLARHYPLFPFPRKPQAGFSFFYDNPEYGANDAVTLFSILLEYRPRRVIEVGSGYSSCLILDTIDRFFDGKLQLTLIDPALEEIRLRIPFGDTGGAELIPAKLQDVPVSVFEGLRENDILFLDSSHVAKTASDVNYYLFEILPALAPGVLIHIHDILHPFEYPEQWVLEEKRSWNEVYAVRAFLQYNREFPILYWTSFATRIFPEKLWALMPLTQENPGGSLWLRKPMH
jgi:predicted O-methyltransferase YrrM